MATTYFLALLSTATSILHDGKGNTHQNELCVEDTCVPVEFLQRDVRVLPFPASKSQPASQPASSEHLEQKSRPLFFNVGHGTTATHALHSGFCALGLSSVHYALRCNNVSGMDLVAHDALIDVYQKRKCFWKDPHQVCPSLKDWVTSMETHLERVLRSDIQAISDVPYTHMVPSMKTMAQRNNRTLVLFMTTRDPEIWAKAIMTEQSTTTTAMFCRSDIWKRGDVGYDPFDLVGCAKRGLEQGKDMWGDIFEVENPFTEDEKRMHALRLMNSMQDFITAYTPTLPASCVIDVFEVSERLGRDLNDDDTKEFIHGCVIASTR